MVAIVRWLFTKKCGNYCSWTPPYGWVPEACCPVHDPDTLIHAYIMRHLTPRGADLLRSGQAGAEDQLSMFAGDGSE